jgi:hypothetical protein
MNNTGYDDNQTILSRRTYGYTQGIGGYISQSKGDMTIFYAAGELYSTTEDLLKWEYGLFGGKLPSQSSLRKMATPYKNDYAFGPIVTYSNRSCVMRSRSLILAITSFGIPRRF